MPTSLMPSLVELVAAMHGTIVGSPPTSAIASFSTDSRKVESGTIFFALRGERHDAHKFITGELLETAAAVVVDHQLDLTGGCQIVVQDTLAALGSAARHWRQRWRSQNSHAKLTALSGSSGKTTTKELLADILGTRAPALVTPGNLNNLIGLPLTLFGLTSDHWAAAVELGMNLPGEARALVEIAQPDAVLLMNILNAHVGMFGTLEDLYQAECETLRYAPSDCTLVLNADDPQSIRARAECAGDRMVVTFGVSSPDADFRAVEVQPIEPYGYRFTLERRADAARAACEIRAFGVHNVSNAAAAAAVACGVHGLDLSTVATAISAFRPRLNRSEVEECNGWWVVKDFYNAVPAAVISALNSLKDFKISGRRIALLADMRELGDLEQQCHEDVGIAAANAGLDILLTVGNKSAIIRDTAHRHGLLQAYHFTTKDALLEHLKPMLREGDLLFIKGSRLLGLETVYEALTGRDAHIH